MKVATLTSLFFALVCIAFGRAEENFTKRENVAVCMKKELIVQPLDAWDAQSCIDTCKFNSMCEAYKLPDIDKTACELYFLNKGSRQRRIPNCNERETIYVRNQKEMEHVQNVFTKRENSLVCMKPEFIAHPNDPWDPMDCMNACKDNSQCQAFKLPDWIVETKCELYIFTKCNEDINRADCTDRATIYVRNQNNLPPGLLCPASFGSLYRLGSSKYLVQKMDNSSWHNGAEFCGSQPGLTKYADALTKEETAYINKISNKIDHTKNTFLGGYLPESYMRHGDWPDHANNLKDGWQWVSCQTAVRHELWLHGEPLRSRDLRYVIMWSNTIPGLSNREDRDTYTDKVLCECIDPF